MKLNKTCRWNKIEEYQGASLWSFMYYFNSRNRNKPKDTMGIKYYCIRFRGKVRKVSEPTRYMHPSSNRNSRDLLEDYLCGVAKDNLNEILGKEN